MCLSPLFVRVLSLVFLGPSYLGRGRPKTRWRVYVSGLALERLGIPSDELAQVAVEREVRVSLLRLLPPDLTQIIRRKWTDENRRFWAITLTNNKVINLSVHPTKSLVASWDKLVENLHVVSVCQRKFFVTFYFMEGLWIFLFELFL